MSSKLVTASGARPRNLQPAVLKQRARECVLFLLGIAGCVVLGVCRLLRPIVRIEIDHLRAARIGQLFTVTTYQLRKRTLRRAIDAEEGVKRRELSLRIVHPGSMANGYAVDMIARREIVMKSRLAFLMLGATRRLRPHSPVWPEGDTFGLEDYETWEKTKPNLISFTPDETARGNALLREMGLPEGAPYICFAVRDPAYLNVAYRPEEQNPPQPANFWSYQDYRDASLESYRPMAEWFASRGYWVLRMGAVVEQPLDWSNPRIIDYASNFRSEFGDIYLLTNCRFFIGDTAGITMVPYAAGVPFALGNYLPLERQVPGADCLIIPKKFRRPGESEFLSFREAYELGALKSNFQHMFVEAGIEPVANSAEEILAMAQELKGRKEGAWRDSDEDRALQRRFWDIWPADHRISAIPYDIAERHYCRIATSFLRLNRRLLD